MKLTQFVTRPLSWLALGAIRCYQLVISPMVPRTCRFAPTCSEYAYRAIKKHGILNGLALAIRRLFRCHPWGGRGFDPVPPGDQHANVAAASESDHAE